LYAGSLLPEPLNQEACAARVRVATIKRVEGRITELKNARVGGRIYMWDQNMTSMVLHDVDWSWLCDCLPHKAPK
jgi:hypothetical protein